MISYFSIIFTDTAMAKHRCKSAAPKKSGKKCAKKDGKKGGKKH